MKLKSILLFSTILVFGFGLGYLAAKPLPPSGTGQYKDAPSGVLTASANSMSELRLLEGNRDFYSFFLAPQGRSPIAVREIRVEAPTEAKIDWREEGEIIRNTNGTAVSFIHSNATWEMELKLKLQAHKPQ